MQDSDGAVETVASSLNTSVVVDEERLFDGLTFTLLAYDEGTPEFDFASASDFVQLPRPCPPLSVSASSTIADQPDADGVYAVTLDGEHSGGCGPFRYEWTATDTGETVSTELDATWNVAGDRLAYLLARIPLEQLAGLLNRAPRTLRQSRNYAPVSMPVARRIEHLARIVGALGSGRHVDAGA